MYKRLLKAALLGLMLVGTLNLALASKKDPFQAVLNEQAKTKTPLLFALSADTGYVSKTIKGTHHLILYNVEPAVLWFFDRPVRQSGFVSVNIFLESWLQLFENDPPNAVVAFKGDDAIVVHQKAPVALELQNPRLKGKHLHFDVKHLKGAKIRLGKIKDVKLFIDN